VDKPIILIGSEATESAFKALLKTDIDLIHFGGHGKWEGGNPSASCLYFHCFNNVHKTRTKVLAGNQFIEKEIEIIDKFHEDEIFRANELATIQFQKPFKFSKESYNALLRRRKKGP